MGCEYGRRKMKRLEVWGISVCIDVCRTADGLCDVTVNANGALKQSAAEVDGTMRVRAQLGSNVVWLCMRRSRYPV